MKKVLLVTHDYVPNTGGVAQYLHGIYSRHENAVVLLDDSLKKEEAKGADALWSHGKKAQTTLYTNFWIPFMYPKWLWLLFKAAKLIKKEQIEEIHVSHVYPLGTLCYLLWKWKKIPYRIYFHGMDIAIARRKQFKRGVLKNIIRYADSVVVNSEFTKQLVQGEVQREVVMWNPRVEPAQEPHAAAVESFKDQFALHGKTVLFTISRLVKRKGVDLVLDALAEVTKTNPNIVYVVAGTGPELQALQTKAQELGLQNTVRFIGRVSEEDKLVWYGVADCFVMPVRDKDPDVEGFGMVYLEAAQHGLPSIATQAGGVPEAVLHNQTGLVVPPEDVEQLAMAIGTLARDEEYRARLGGQAKQRAAQLTWGEEFPEELL